jgi:hypothetical protein
MMLARVQKVSRVATFGSTRFEIDFCPEDQHDYGTELVSSFCLATFSETIANQYEPGKIYQVSISLRKL